jgi:Gram-negative bacterial TonB protein C-terminal
MKVLRVSVLSCLALAGVVAGIARMRVYNEHAAQQSANSLRQYRAAARRLEKERVAICEERRKVFLEPSEVSPENIGRPVPIHAEFFPTGERSPVGTFVAEVLIDEGGCVRQAKILQSPDRSLDAVAAASFEKWAYQPVIRNHRPVRVIGTLSLELTRKDPGVLVDRVVDEDGYSQ